MIDSLFALTISDDPISQRRIQRTTQDRDVLFPGLIVFEIHLQPPVSSLAPMAQTLLHNSEANRQHGPCQPRSYPSPDHLYRPQLTDPTAPRARDPFPFSR